MHLLRNKYGALIAEAGIAIPIFLFMIFGIIEISRMLYIKSTLSSAAQQVADLISINATKTASNYTLSSFKSFADSVRYPGSVIDSNQFSFDVSDASNNSTVANGTASGITSTKVVVTVKFPPSSSSVYKVPFFDPGLLFGTPLFGQNGLSFSTQAVCFLEKSRRPILN